MPSQPPQTRNEPGDEPDLVIVAVLDSLRQSRATLLDPSPRNIDRCSIAVAGCIQKIGETIQAHRENQGLRSSLLLVRDELNAITALLDSAAAFRRDMLKAISDATPSNVVPIDAGPNRVRHVHVLG